MKFLKMSCLLLTCLVFCTCSRPEYSPPNIILIMADDLGYGDLGIYGSERISTPSLDSLARYGLRFTDYHANAPVCTPTRAALLTGRYQQRAGLEGVIYVKGDTRQTGMDTTQLTLAKQLRRQGYKTGIMGKWHLGYRTAYNPIHHGFDEFYGYVSGNIDYHSHYDNAGIYDWWHNLDTIKEEGYATDLITQHSIDFIEQHKEQPFFLYVAHEAPHVPFQGRNDPAYRLPGTEFSYYGPVEDRHRAYREMVEVMDEGVGRIMETLRKHKLEDNTVVFFVSDNGALADFGNNGALNGQKGQLLEGGHRVPAIAYWKNRIRPGESSELLLSMDLMPTILQLSGSTPAPELLLDGISFSPLLLEGESPEERTVFWRYRKEKAARNPLWKLLITPGDTALYDMEKDIGESRNLYRQHPDEAAVLLRQLEAWEAELSVVPMKTL